MAIFNSYVSLPEGKPFPIGILTQTVQKKGPTKCQLPASAVSTKCTVTSSGSRRASFFTGPKISCAKCVRHVHSSRMRYFMIC